MITVERHTGRAADDEARPSTLVWIDAAAAVIVRRRGDRTRLERLESEVPAHHRATTTVRHDPTIRHGGGGGAQTAGEPHRLEHLKRFVVEIANRLGPDDDLLIIGPASVRERLARHLAESDRHHGRRRDIVCEPSPRMSDRQLIARLGRFAGVEPRAFSVGAYRWSEPPAHRRSGTVDHLPRRVIDKPPRERPGRL